MACQCGLDVQQPWRTRNNLWSPASFIGGLLIVALGIGALFGIREWFGWLILGLLGLSVAISCVVQAIRGHRRIWCLFRRGIWFGIATPGSPVRLLPYSW